MCYILNNTWKSDTEKFFRVFSKANIFKIKGHTLDRNSSFRSKYVNYKQLYNILLNMRYEFLKVQY